MKAHALKRDLSDIKNSMSEINNLATIGRTTTPTIGDMKMSNNSAMSQLQQRFVKFFFKFTFKNYSYKISLPFRIRSSLENLVDGNENEPLVTFPENDSADEDLHLELTPTMSTDHLTNGQLQTTGTTSSKVEYEQKRSMTASKTQVITDGFSSEQATSNSAEMKRYQAGDVEYKEAMQQAAIRNRIEIDGVSAEQNSAVKKVINFRNYGVTGLKFEFL